MRRTLCALALMAVLCLSFLPGAAAEQGQETWTRQFGTTGLDAGRAVAADATGVYVTGETEGALEEGQLSAGGEDAFLRKYDLAGSPLWTRQFGSGGDDRPAAVAVDATGVYLVGSTEATLPGQASGSLFAHAKAPTTRKRSHAQFDFKESRIHLPFLRLFARPLPRG